jgi:aminopeptidase N
MRRLLLVVAAVFLLACPKKPSGSGSGPIGPIDAGALDAGFVDAGPVDAGAIDAGVVDAGQLDSGPVDSGPVDAGIPDAGQSTGFVDYQATHYDFHFDLSSLAATAQVTLLVEPGDGGSDGGNCISIPFRPTSYHDVTLGGVAPSLLEVSDAGVLIACDGTGNGLHAGDQVVLSVGTTVAQQTLGASQVGYSVRNDLSSSPFSYLLSWEQGCDQFGPCDNRPNIFATYHFTVDHPSGTTLLCPGTLSPGATESSCDFALPGGPTYSTFAFFASPSWTQTDLGNWSGVQITLYHRPNDGFDTAIDQNALGGYLQWLVSLFGPYPFGSELRYATGPTYWSGFEHPGNILVNERLPTSLSPYSDPLNHTLKHELTHMWAGDQTTLADTYDFVWKEAVAEYMTFVFEEEQIDAGVAQATASAWKQWAGAARHYPVPLDHPALFDYYSDAYGPGPMVLFRQLEIRFGRSAILTALQSVLGNGQSTLSVDQLRAALEASTGADLSSYFSAWVEGSGQPAWLTGLVQLADLDGGSVQVGVAISDTDGVPRSCQFTVQLQGDGGEALDVPFDVVPDAGQPPAVVVQPGFVVTRSVLDPYSECLIYQAGVPRPRGPGVDPWRVP